MKSEILIKNIVNVIKENKFPLLYKKELNGDNYWLAYDEFEGLKIVYGKPAPIIRKVDQALPKRSVKKFPIKFEEILIIYKQIEKRLASINSLPAKKLLNILSANVENISLENFKIEWQNKSVEFSFNSNEDIQKINKFIDELKKRIDENNQITKNQYFELRTEIENLKKQIEEKDAESVKKTFKKIWNTLSNIGTIIGYTQLFLGLIQ